MIIKFYWVLFCFMLFPLQGFALDPGEKLLYEKNSLYQYISVIEDTARKERYLRNQKKDVSQGGMSLTTPEKLLLEYTQMSFISLAFLDRELSQEILIDAANDILLLILERMNIIDGVEQCRQLAHIEIQAGKVIVRQSAL